MIKKSVIGFLLISFVACDTAPEEKDKPIEWSTKESTNMHKELALEEEIAIDLFLAQHADWKMTKTGSGLQYYIYEKGNGAKAKVGDLAQVEYAITLLDGTKCYQTASDEVEEFQIDKADIETGIQEGVKLLNKGDRVKFIIPSHLAHGLIGDMNKIPPLTTIVVDFYLYDLL